MVPHLLALALGVFLGFASESPVVFLLCWWAFALAFSHDAVRVPRPVRHHTETAGQPEFCGLPGRGRTNAWLS